MKYLIFLLLAGCTPEPEEVWRTELRRYENKMIAASNICQRFSPGSGFSLCVSKIMGKCEPKKCDRE